MNEFRRRASRAATVRVLLIDDHAVVRAGYRHYLSVSPHLHVIAEAENAGQGYRLALQDPPDVAVIDLSLPGASGLALISRLSARLPDVRCLAFTMHEEPMMMRRALDHGAMGYVSKRAPPQALREAIDALAAGHRFIRLGDGADGPIPAAADSLDALSPREFEVFRQMAQGRRAADIARDLQLSTKTVANYGVSIRTKLGVPTAAALARLGIASGVVPMSAPGSV